MCAYMMDWEKMTSLKTSREHRVGHCKTIARVVQIHDVKHALWYQNEDDLINRERD